MTAELRDLSLIVPAYNEATRLPATLRALQTYLAARPWRSEIVVVDDGSTDGTVEVTRAAVTPALPLRIVSLDVNRGKGAAVTRGVAEARGRYLGFIDADLPYALDDIDRAMARLADGADVVIGGRDLPGSRATVDYSAVRSLSTRMFAALVARLVLRGIPDTQCGFKWFKTAVARQLFSRITVTSFAFDVELLVLAQRWALRIDRIPVCLTHSSDSRIRLVRDSGRMIWDLLKINRRLARGAYDRP
jgi:dolichyl-phosphate beta-glucosyltransferase